MSWQVWVLLAAGMLWAWSMTRPPKHHHDFKRTVIVQAKGSSIQNCTGYNSDEYLKILNGITTVLYECQVPSCSEIKRMEMTGVLYHESRPITEKRG